MPRTGRRRALATVCLAGAFGALALLALASTMARAADPRVGIRLPVRAGAGDAGGLLEQSARNRSRFKLPLAPSLGFQVRLAPPIIGIGPAAADGHVLVAHGSDRVTSLDAGGRSVWSVRLGAELASGPIPLAGDQALLVARDGRLFEVSTKGFVSERESVAWSDVDGVVVSAPTSDGGAILANGARLARVGARGLGGFQTKVPSPIGAVLAWRGATLAVGRDGTVWLRGSAGSARELTSLGDAVSAVFLVGDRLLGLGHHALLRVDLGTRKRAVLWSDSAEELHDLAESGDGKLQIVAGRAILVELDADGHELSRTLLPTAESGVELAHVIVDDAGTRYVGASGAPLLVVTREGDSAVVPGTSCPDPLRPTPVADGRILAVCRSGLLRGVSDKGR